jgi:diguanylate cyclase (GGDEF)-like protein
MKKNVFRLLSIYMFVFCLLIGVSFPFIVVAFGGSKDIFINLKFFSLCVAAGLVLGFINNLLARALFVKKISRLSDYMRFVEMKISNINTTSHIEDIEKSQLCIDANDKIGDCARAFDSLLVRLLYHFKIEKVIRTFSNLLNSDLEISTMANKALLHLSSNLSAKGGAIIIEKNGELKVISSHRIVSPESLLENKLLWEILKSGKRQYLSMNNSVHLDGVLAKFRPSHTLIEPIKYQTELLGAVILANDEPFNEDSLQLLEILSNNMGLALRNAIMHEQLSRLAAKDPLTDLYNRRFGLQRMREEYSRALRNKAPLGIAMLDIDFFKAINDTYGHLVGDKVIVEISKTIKSTLRQGDIAIRYGGEEFMLILPGASLRDCKILAERIRRLIEDLVVTHLQYQIRCTISIGISSYPEYNVKKIEDLIECADKGLYTAKQAGKNRFVVGYDD